MYRTAVFLVVLLLLMAACGGSAGEGTTAGPSSNTITAQASTTMAPGTVAPSTTTVAPTTTTVAPTTTVDVPPTVPPDMEARYPVVMADGISGPDTENITVWAPDAEGRWPIVMLLPGWEGKGIHYAQTAEMLAGHGVVVFATDIRSKDIATANWRNPFRDAECAYRYIRNVASDYGGDIEHPITIAGHSLGASIALAIVLFESEFGPDGSFDRCPGQLPPRPDHVVGLSGCYAKSAIDDSEFPFAPNAQGWTHLDAAIHLVVGSDDTVCEAWQSEQAATTLMADGYLDVELTVIEAADHFDVMFLGYRGDTEWYEPGGEWFAKPNDPGGVATVRAILDAVTKGS